MIKNNYTVIVMLITLLFKISIPVFIIKFELENFLKQNLLF